LIHHVISFVVIAWFPNKNAVSMLHICNECASVVVAVRSLILPPFSFSMFEPVFKLPCIRCAVSPFISALTVRLTFAVHTLKWISVCKNISSVPVLEWIEPLSFVFVPVFPNMNYPTLNMAWIPLSDVALALFAFPDSNALFYAFLPLTVVNFTILPCVYSFSMCFIILKLA
jgi:hypothetical protein